MPGKGGRASYAYLGDQSLTDILRHFTSRGHVGRVQSVDASNGLEFVCSGGVDYTTRVWKFDQSSKSHTLEAIVNHPRPQVVEYEPTLSCFKKAYRFAFPPKVAWDNEGAPRQGVTAVACVASRSQSLFSDQPERIGPFLSATAHGDLAGLCLFNNLQSSDKLCTVNFPGLHNDAVNDLAFLPCYADGSNGTTFIIVTASDDCESAMLKLECEDISVTGRKTDVLALRRCEELQGRRFKHDGPVLQVKQLGDNTSSSGACFATATEHGIHLLSMEATELTRLKIGAESLRYFSKTFQTIKDIAKFEDLPVSNIAVSNRASGSLLFAEGGSYVVVWSLREGRVAARTKDGALDYDSTWEEALQDPELELEPLGAYKQGWPNSRAGLQVDQSASRTSFAAQIISTFTCRLWTLEAVRAGLLLLELQDPANSLIMPGRESSDLEVQHTSAVYTIRVRNDFEQTGALGSALLTACDNGTIYGWDVEGKDKGQIYTCLRSLGIVEIFLPPFMMLASALQFLSFAFGRSIPWKEEVHVPAMKAHQAFLLDPTIFKEKFTTLTVFSHFTEEIIPGMETVFWLRTFTVLGVMVVFMLLAMTGATQNLEAMMRFVQDTDAFNAEVSSNDFFHVVVKFLKAVKAVTNVFMQLCATVLVAPVVLCMVEAVDCNGTTWENLKSFNKDGNITLEFASSVKCYRGDHLKLTMVIYLVTIPYLILLFPWAAVMGDCNYMPRSTLYNYKMWNHAACRKAATINMGFLHQVPSLAFKNQTVELLAKILLPVCTTWTTSKVRLQIGLVSIICGIMYINARLFPGYVEEKFCIVVQDLKLFTVLVSMTGLVTAILNKEESMLPVYLLILCVVGVVWHLGYMLYKVPASRPNVRVTAISNHCDALDSDSDYQEEGNNVRSWTTYWSNGSKEHSNNMRLITNSAEEEGGP